MFRFEKPSLSLQAAKPFSTSKFLSAFSKCCSLLEEPSPWPEEENQCHNCTGDPSVSSGLSLHVLFDFDQIVGDTWCWRPWCLLTRSPRGLIVLSSRSLNYRMTGGLSRGWGKRGRLGGLWLLQCNWLRDCWLLCGKGGWRGLQAGGCG